MIQPKHVATGLIGLVLVLAWQPQRIIQPDLLSYRSISSFQTTQVVAACKTASQGPLVVPLPCLQWLFTTVSTPAVPQPCGGSITGTAPHAVLGITRMDGLSIFKTRSAVSLVTISIICD